MLKPSHKKQLSSWLRRATRLGMRAGGFGLDISLRRTGRWYEAAADVRDVAGGFDCRCRQTDCRDALRQLSSMIAHRLHHQRILAARAA